MMLKNKTLICEIHTYIRAVPRIGKYKFLAKSILFCRHRAKQLNFSSYEGYNNLVLLKRENKCLICSTYLNEFVVFRSLIKCNLYVVFRAYIKSQCYKKK